MRTHHDVQSAAGTVIVEMFGQCYKNFFLYNMLFIVCWKIISIALCKSSVHFLANETILPRITAAGCWGLVLFRRLVRSAP